MLKMNHTGVYVLKAVTNFLRLQMLLFREFPAVLKNTEDRDCTKCSEELIQVTNLFGEFSEGFGLFCCHVIKLSICLSNETKCSG